MTEQLLLGLRVPAPRLADPPVCDHAWNPAEPHTDIAPCVVFRCGHASCGAYGFIGRARDPRDRTTITAALCGCCCCMRFATHRFGQNEWCSEHRLPSARAKHVAACTTRKLLPWWFNKTCGPTGKYETPFVRTSTDGAL